MHRGLASEQRQAVLAPKMGFHLTKEFAMSKQNHTPEQAQREAMQSQQEKAKSQQRAETKEVAGRHKNDGQKDHKGSTEVQHDQETPSTQKKPTH